MESEKKYSRDDVTAILRFSFIQAVGNLKENGTHEDDLRALQTFCGSILGQVKGMSDGEWSTFSELALASEESRKSKAN